MVLVGASNQLQVAGANQILTSLLKTSHRIRTVDLASYFAVVLELLACSNLVCSYSDWTFFVCYVCCN
jgi:hypothetical protein